MTPADLRRAERLAPAIAMYQRHGSPRAHRGHVDRGVDSGGVERVPTWDGRVITLARGLSGDQRRGWVAGMQSRRSVVRGQPPDTVDGIAGWIAAQIAWCGP